MGSNKPHRKTVRRYLCLGAIVAFMNLSGCLHYGFTGASIPEGVNSIYIPFFANQYSSNVPDLSDRLNNVLVDRFINQSKLHLANDQGSADAVLEGAIQSYRNAPFSVTGNEQANQNQVTITVHATFKFTKNDKPEYSKDFNGSATYDPTKDPINGENDAAQKALEQIAGNMFNDAVSGW